MTRGLKRQKLKNASDFFRTDLLDCLSWKFFLQKYVISFCLNLNFLRILNNRNFFTWWVFRINAHPFFKKILLHYKIKREWVLMVKLFWERRFRVRRMGESILKRFKAQNRRFLSILQIESTSSASCLFLLTLTPFFKREFLYIVFWQSSQKNL